VFNTGWLGVVTGIIAASTGRVLVHTKTPRWRTATILKNQNLSNGLTDHHEVWRDDAHYQIYITVYDDIARIIH